MAQTEERTNAKRMNKTYGWTDGRTDRQAGRQIFAGRNDNNNTRVWPWAISVSKEGRLEGARVEFVICKSLIPSWRAHACVTTA